MFHFSCGAGRETGLVDPNRSARDRPHVEDGDSKRDLRSRGNGRGWSGGLFTGGDSPVRNLLFPVTRPLVRPVSAERGVGRGEGLFLLLVFLSHLLYAFKFFSSRSRFFRARLHAPPDRP